MPTLPTYDSKQNIQPMQSEPLRNEAAIAGQQDQKVIGALQDMAKAWSDAHDVMQYTEAKFNYDAQVVDIQSRAMADTDFKNRGKYYKELQDAKSKSLKGINNRQVADKLSVEMDFGNEIASIKIRTDGQKKEVAYNKIMLDQELDLKAKFMAFASGNEKDSLQDEIDELFLINTNSGLIDTEYEEKKRKQMAKSSILFVAEQDPTQALVLAREDKDLSPDDKVSLIRDIESISKIQTKQDSIATLVMQGKTQKSFLDRQDSMTYEEKLLEINRGIESGTMNESWAKAKKTALLSSKGVDARTQTEYLYDIVRKINSASANYEYNEDSESAEEYLKTLLSAETDIEKGISQGLLDEDDRKYLYNRIHTKAASKARVDLPDDLSYAVSYFEKQLPRKNVSEAIRNYIAVTDRMAGSNFDYEDMVRKIKSQVLRSQDPTFITEDKTNIDNVSVFKVGDEVVNPATGETFRMGDSGQWIPVL